jgi:hypothetical protein
MKWIMGLSAGAVLFAANAFAQSGRPDGGQALSAPPAQAGERADQVRRSPGPPTDAGPRTPEADRAHRGGGVVLEGAPGAPALNPQPTPPAGPAGQQLPRR